MEITAKMVKELRDLTGAGPLDCKKTLEEFGGDVEKAASVLRERGLVKAAKKAGRATNEGIIEVYQHHNRRVGVMVEVNCETDFVAKTEKFKELAHGLALHIANMAPQFVRRADVPAGLIESERARQQAWARGEGKPEHILDRIVEGRMAKFYRDIVLMEQEYILDDDKTVEQIIKEAIADLGENIQIARFARFALSEGEEAGPEAAE
jgi:elongation factor Ts